MVSPGIPKIKHHWSPRHVKTDKRDIFLLPTELSPLMARDRILSVFELEGEKSDVLTAVKSAALCPSAIFHDGVSSFRSFCCFFWRVVWFFWWRFFFKVCCFFNHWRWMLDLTCNGGYEIGHCDEDGGRGGIKMESFWSLHGVFSNAYMKSFFSKWL